MNAIDLFAGAGGFTEGATQAGVNVVWSANHWQLAVDFHAANHRSTQHVCQDLHQADWSKVPTVDIVLASPCCQGHTKARGSDRPTHDASRSTAWAVVSCCETIQPRAFIVENVPEFLRWKLFPAWASAMDALSYRLSATVIDAAYCGLAQHRSRLFIVGSRDDFQLRQPEPVATATARDIIDFTAGSWSHVESPRRAAATLSRVGNGRRQFGQRFVMPYYGSGSGLTGRSLDRPLGTVTTRDRWAVVDHNKMRMLTVDEYRRAMGFPDGYQLPATRHEAIHLLGNAVPPPMARFVVAQVAEAIAA